MKFKLRSMRPSDLTEVIELGNQTAEFLTDTELSNFYTREEMERFLVRRY